MKGKEGGKGIRVLGRPATAKTTKTEEAPKEEEHKPAPEAVVEAPRSCIILKCTCQNKWMDKTYGKGMRVHNKKRSLGLSRCASCGTDKGKETN